MNGTTWIAWDCQSSQQLPDINYSSLWRSCALSSPVQHCFQAFGKWGCLPRVEQQLGGQAGVEIAASAGLVSAASSSWLHKRAAVNSVTREVFLEIQHPTRHQSIHDNKCPLCVGLAHGKGSAITCLVGIWRQTKLLPG